MSYTKGPWTVENHIDSFSIRAIKTNQDDFRIPENRTVIDTILTIDEGTLPNKANGYLLAAAPDMLDAIETVINKELELSFDSLCILKAAIKKARGN